jgi:hypothetical protein
LPTGITSDDSETGGCLCRHDQRWKRLNVCKDRCRLYCGAFLFFPPFQILPIYKMYFSVLATSIPFLSHLAQATLVQGNDGSAASKEALVNLSPDVGNPVQPSSNTSDHPASESSFWSEPVKCTPKEKSAEPFCVYTDSSFAAGRGISFFTTPSIQDRISSMPAFTKKGVHKNANKFEDVPYEVRTVLGRGRGLFATQTLSRGDIILSSTPLGVYHQAAFHIDHQLDYKYLHTALNQLPKASQDIFLSTMAGEGDPIMDRVNINGFAADFEGAPHFLMYAETAVSRIASVSLENDD